MALVTAAALLPVNAPLAKVTVRLLMSLLLAWAVALPARANVACVASTRVTVAVSPPGMLLTVTPDKACPLVPVKVSLVSVRVTVLLIEPSLATASEKVVAL